MQKFSILKNSRVFKFYGRLGNDVARGVVAACDFLVLLRQDRRFSRAGFPSNVAESLCLGTAIITNLSSSLAEHLVHMQNSIVVSKPDALSLCDALRIAEQLSEQALGRMKILAMECGDIDFSPKRKAGAISEFIQGVVTNKISTHVNHV